MSPKYMPYVTVADIQISLLFEENAILLYSVLLIIIMIIMTLLSWNNFFVLLSSFELFDVQFIRIETSRAFPFVFIF